MARAKSSLRIPSMLVAMAVIAVFMAGCARYNTFYNAEQAFKEAEHVRTERLKTGDDVTKPTANQAKSYQATIKKCLKLLENYPGHSLTDDALFLMGKSYHRLQQYNSSIEQLDLLFQNYPANPFEEESLFLQAANHMLTGNISQSNNYLDQLRDQFPLSRFQAEAYRVQGENAFSLERWAEASESYRLFVEFYPDDERVGEVGLMLGRSLWMLHDYETAAIFLEQSSAVALEREDIFEAKLLQARCFVRLDRLEEVDELLDSIVDEAEFYEARGMIAIVRAENHIAKGEPGEAEALVSNMPGEWFRGDVQALTGEILGEIYLADWNLDEAYKAFKNASRNSRVTNNPERVKRLNDDLQLMNLTEGRLEGAREQDRPALLLVQANILQLSLDRPRLALDLYLEIGSLAELDTLSAVRGLFGAAVLYREQLALPDSAVIMENRLLETFPHSPQALLLREGTEADLYSYLMERDRERALFELAQGITSTDAHDGSAMLDSRGGIIETPSIGITRTGRYSRWRIRKLEKNAQALQRTG